MNTSTRPFWSVANLVRDPHVMGSPSVMLENINSGTGTLRSEISNNDAEKTGTPFKDGDILFGKLRPYLAKSWHATWNGVAVGDIHVYRPYGNSDSQFLSYVVQSSDFLKYAENHSYGTKMPRCEWSSISRFQLADLSLETQQRIADYLDRETAEIDAAVADLDRYVELLEKRRSSKISQAVHSGPSVPLNYIVQISDGLVDPRESPFAEMPLIAPNHIEKNTGRLIYPIDSAAEQGAVSGKGEVLKGQIMYSKIRPALNKVAIAPFDALCSADMYPLKIVGDLEPRFLLYSMLSERFRAEATLESDRVAMPKVNRESLGRMRIHLPSVSAQREIINRLDRETAEIDSLIADSTKLRELLLKRRSVLITDVVTGRKQV